MALCLGGGVYGWSLGAHVTQSGFFDDGSESAQASRLGDEVLRQGHLGPYRGDLHRSRTARPSTTRPSGRRSSITSPRSRRTTRTRSFGPLVTSRPQTVLRNMADADKTHAFMSIQLKGDNDDLILKNYKEVQQRLRRPRRRCEAGRFAAVGQRADRDHRHRPAAGRGARPAAGGGFAVLRVRWCGRRVPAGDHRRADHRGRARHHAADRDCPCRCTISRSRWSR